MYLQLIILRNTIYVTKKEKRTEIQKNIIKMLPKKKL